ncbi:hypothetical protein M0R45_034841 [Rubus argutus]|uniref:Uncharacterized protein n=1 Tax=Rubus argutus TaxID=59490 RepID=A0AAW1VS80_RUBAR
MELSLLTPYVQLLGIPHTWAAFIWLCGPISGMLVRPIVGYHSENCTSSSADTVFLISYAADLGHLFGDSLDKTTKPRAIAVFVVGFWILDVANNMLQGRGRALLADISGSDTKKMRTANGFYSFFMAVGNVLGFSAGSYTHLHKMFPFTLSKACDQVGSVQSTRNRSGWSSGAEPPPPPSGIKAGALVVFAVLGIPQAVTYSVPFALASIFCSNAGAGQGLSLGVLNLAIVVPQMIVSVASGPWDALFGGAAASH